MARQIDSVEEAGLSLGINFVLCDKENIEPLIAIELDDSSHGRPDRMARDIFIDRVMVPPGCPFYIKEFSTFMIPRS